MAAARKKQFFLGSTHRKRALRIDYAAALNAEQLAAVQAPPGPVLVIAGAGTGKTRVITYRVAYLLETCAKPEDILLLTFTNKAAREMMSRIEGLVSTDVDRIWGGTFHSIAHRILRKHAPRLGYKGGYSILDREDSRSLMRAAIQERSGDKKTKGKRRFPQAQVLESIKSLTINTQTHADLIVATRYAHLADRTEGILEVLRIYEERKRAANAMDYDDLLWNWLKLLDDREFLEQLRGTFKHVLVDEYQDTNRLQSQIIDLLCLPDRSVTVVGDDAQAIYGWRGAEPENILLFPQRYDSCHMTKLETNYRSTPEVLAVANRAISANPLRFEKNLHASRKSGLRPEVVPCSDAFQQSRFVAERIIQMHEDGMPLEHIAILYRSHWNAMELQLELQRRDIPFIIRGGIRFFEQAHIKDATSFLRAVENPRDELAWLRILPLVPNVGPATARKIATRLETSSSPLQALASDGAAALVGKRAAQPFGRFVKLLADIATPDMRQAPAEMLREVVDEFYGDYLYARFANARQRAEDLAQLSLYAAQFQSAESFLAELAISGMLESETSPVGPDEDRYVTLSTVHQAKGLEWPVVFIIWLSDGRFPTDFAGRVEGGYEEERRLFHVAVTRARDELVMTYPMVYRWRGMDPTLMKRSRFLAELDDPAPPPYDIVELLEPAEPELILPITRPPVASLPGRVGAETRPLDSSAAVVEPTPSSARSTKPKATTRTRPKKAKKPKDAKKAKKAKRAPTPKPAKPAASTKPKKKTKKRKPSGK